MRQATIEYVDISKLKEAERNPKDHSLGMIEESMTRFGFTIPLLLDEGSQRLVAGHGRLKALRRLRDRGAGPPAGVSLGDADEWLVPVLRGIGFTDEKEAEAYLLADNRLTELGGWDQIALSEMLSDLSDAGSLMGVGWSHDDLDEMLAQVEAATPGEVGDEGTNGRDLGDKRKQIKIVLYAEQVGVFEAALTRTGLINRGEAVLAVCESYLENHAKEG